MEDLQRTKLPFSWKRLVLAASLSPKQIFELARSSGEDFCDIEKQEEIFNCVIWKTSNLIVEIFDDPWLKQFPISKRYLKSFLAYWINAIENENQVQNVDANIQELLEQIFAMYEPLINQNFDFSK